MHRSFPGVALLALAACAPTLNWRELTIESTPLKAALPCKPDRVERKIEMAPGEEFVLHATGCAAGGATFAVLYADIQNPAVLNDMLARWKKASLASTRSSASREAPFQPVGALGLPGSQRVRAQGRRPDGTAIESDAAYFAHGTQVFQAVVYADHVKPEFADPFFAGLHFQ